ncbi:MAG: ABC transporter ATP-binding protein [Syntrophomonas sp.]
MAFILDHIYKKFEDLYVLTDLNMRVEENKLVCVLGPSGCGKTTLLNIISRVIAPDTGTLSGFTGKSISYLFQEPRLLPWKTVEQNIDFVLKDKLTRTQRTEIIDRYLNMVNLREFRNYYPGKLSGGMKQRVAIARAFAYPADILLMDEPFKGLDLQMKSSLIQDFIRIWLNDRRSVFFVTHDINEALLVGEEIYVLTERPTSVKGTVLNDVPYRERDMQNEKMRNLEKQVYKLITNRDS